MIKTMSDIAIAITSITLNSFAFFFLAGLAQALLNMVLAPFGIPPLSWLESTAFWGVFFGLALLVKHHGR